MNEFTARRDPGVVVRVLADGLHWRGVRGLYARVCRQVGLLSVSAGLTVWSGGRVLSWRQGGEHVTWPAADTAGAAQRLAALASQREAVARSACRTPGSCSAEAAAVVTRRV